MTRDNPLAARLSTGVVGLAAVGLLSGCAAQAAAPAASAPAAAAPTASASAAQPAGEASSSSAAPASSTAAAPTSGYTDGTFTKTAPYQTPGGPETVTVKMGLRSGKVASVTVTGSESTPNAKHYVGAFAGGISGQVVGKRIAGLKVGAIAGSSLTPNGFNAAVAKIAAAAKA